ncbi:hypothetical protein [Aliivibrio fischeri]|uniref:hypothetical protein n=1 Tax=Aliivibrio fischeri TaxID=668 RepID=UPI0007C56CAB|nr:hypothetical protein [Aliivibrio fischeri]
MKSREVYDDCCYARDELEKAIEEGNYQKAKILWFSCLTLLRAIGHVLHKVDQPKYDDFFSTQLDEKYKFWIKHEPIFKDFIDKERNKIVKEYASSLDVEEIVKEKVLVTNSGLRIVTNSGQSILATTTLRSLVKARGHLAGKTPISVLNSALIWWNEQLDYFEGLARN